MTSIVLVAVLLLAGADPAPAHRDAAAELLQVMDLERTMMAAATAIVDSQIAQMPALGLYRDVIVEWAGKCLTWENVGPRMVDLYAQTFEENELREMIAFYRTPVGRKALAEMPALMQQGAAIGAEVAREHLSELEAMIDARSKALEEDKGVADPPGDSSYGS